MYLIKKIASELVQWLRRYKQGKSVTTAGRPHLVLLSASTHLLIINNKMLAVLKKMLASMLHLTEDK